jgi:2'-hydroxyisoflavone reductase
VTRQSTRRRFISTVAFAVAAAGLDLPAHAAPLAEGDTMNHDKQLHVLILGGTGFLGPATIESALARGHKVTIFNTGRSEERRQANGRPSVVPDGVEILIGNRDPDKTADDRRLAQLPPGAEVQPDPNSPKGLAQLEGRTFDAVVDTSGYFPRHVRASAELLAPSVKQYIFISTLSVYADNAQPGMDESAPLGTIEDPAVEDMGPGGSYYGPLKALCEQAAEEAMPGRVTILRPGFIVGPRDTSARFMFWPVRIAQGTGGGEMLIPGDEGTLIQVIDVRDLADFTIHCIEENITGAFNVTGRPMTMRNFVEQIRDGVNSDTTFAFIGKQAAETYKLGFGQFPLYIPQEGEYAGFHQRDISKAVAAGLTFRPLPDTARATLEWYNDLPADVQPKLLPQGRLTTEREQEILAAVQRATDHPTGDRK